MCGEGGGGWQRGGGRAAALAKTCSRLFSSSVHTNRRATPRPRPSQLSHGNGQSLRTLMHHVLSAHKRLLIILSDCSTEDPRGASDI